MTWFYQHPSGDAYYNDVEESACAWLRELMIAGEIAPGIIDNRSILEVQPTNLIGFTQCHFFAGIGGWSLALRLAGWPDNRPVWTGSPPCQPFSVAGENKGKDDERHLAPHFVGLVRACRPRVLFGEQVASSAVFGKAAKGRRGSSKGAPEWAWIDDLSDRLEAARYAAWAVDFPSAGVGAPHIRQRTYFGAVDTLGLADSASGGRSEKRQDGDGGIVGDSAQGVTAGFGGRGGSVGLADADSRKCDRISEHGEHDRDRTQTGREQRDCEPSRGGETERLADHHGDGCDQGRERVTTTGHDGVERDGSVGRVVNGVITGLEGQRRDGDDRHEPGRLDQGAIESVAEASAVDWLADCASGGRGEERQDGGGGFGGDSAQGQPAGLGAGRGDSWLGNAPHKPCERDAGQFLAAQEGVGGAGVVDGDSAIRSEHAGSGVGGVAGPRRSFAEWFGICWNDCGGNCTCGNRDDAPGGWLWDADEGWIDIVAFLNLQRRADDGPIKLDTVRPGTPDSFWSDPDWLFCRDGKWRPVEPGSQPLAHGVPGRVGLLRGYGNAINPQQAAVFIEESAQALAEAGPLRMTHGMTTDSLEVFG